MRWLIVPLLAASLVACGGNPVKTPTSSTTSDMSRTSATKHPNRPTPVTHSRPDKPGEYTAGGLYKPGVADGGPPVPPDISHLVEPEPTNEPPARYGNRSPYTVLGKNYYVMENADGYVARGIASWYGSKFHGRATSSLEPYDMYQFTAAHKSLPLPTHVRVTHLENGRSVVVRVNDRGPFHEDRLIDLSYAAAIKLGMHIHGTAPVEIRVLRPDETPPPPPAAMPSAEAWAAARQGSTVNQRPVTSTTTSAKPVSTPPAIQGRVWLQVASFGEAINAQRLIDRLQANRVGRTEVQRAQVSGRTVFRVRVGPFDSAEKSKTAVDTLHAMGLGVPTLVTE